VRRLSARPRPGFTLVELLVSMTLLGVVLAGVLGVLARQQRFYRDLVDVIESRRQLRHALAVLQPELRALSVDPSAEEGSDLLALGDSAVELRAFIGSSVICRHDSVSLLELPARVLASGSVLTSWHAAPRARDVALVYDEGPADGGADDRWRAYEIAEQSESRTFCASSPLLRADDAAQSRYRVTLAAGATLSATIRAGAPIRFARRTRYSLYRSADRAWFLGQREWNGAWSTIQPVSGPYRPFTAAPASSGLAFSAMDAAGNAVDADGPVAALIVTVRARTSAPLASPGFARGWRDASAAAVAVPAAWQP